MTRETSLTLTTREGEEIAVTGPCVITAKHHQHNETKTVRITFKAPETTRIIRRAQKETEHEKDDFSYGPKVVRI